LPGTILGVIAVAGNFNLRSEKSDGGKMISSILLSILLRDKRVCGEHPIERGRLMKSFVGKECYTALV
jgi:hypothetical protein